MTESPERKSGRPRSKGAWKEGSADSKGSSQGSSQGSSLGSSASRDAGTGSDEAPPPPSKAPPPSASLPLTPAAGASDRPAAHDSLDRGPLVDALAGLISHPQTDVPMTIGVYGAWGSGKSSVLAQLTSRLAARDHRIVELNPWRLGHRDAIWTAMIDGVASALDHQVGALQRLKFLVRRGLPGQEAGFISGLRARTTAGAKKVHNWLLGTVTALGISSSKSAEIPIVGEPVASVLNSQLTLTVLAFGVAAVILWKAWQTTQSPLLTQLQAYRKSLTNDGERVRKLGHEELDVMRAMVQASARKEPPHKKPIVVCIDDLDRCPPDRIVEVLESVNLCLAGLPFVTVLALDSSYVSHAVSHEYAFMLDKDAIRVEKEAYGLRFLEKIINIPFQLPPPTGESLKTYLESLVAPKQGADGRAGSGAKPEKVAAEEPKGLQVDDADRKILGSYTGSLQGNPRSIKRFVNTYRLAKSISSQYEGRDRADLRSMTAWLVAYQNWPRETARLDRALSDSNAGPQALQQVQRGDVPDNMLEFISRRREELQRALQSKAGMQITRCFSFLADGDGAEVSDVPASAVVANEKP